MVGKSPEEKKAEDEAKRALEDTVPDTKEGAVEEAVSVEVEWSEDHSSVRPLRRSCFML